MSTSTIFAFALAVIVSLAAGYGMWHWYDASRPGPYQSVGDPTFGLKRYEDITTSSSNPQLPEGYSKYVNGRLKFSVEYPSFYVPNEVRETAISTSVLFAPVGGGTGVQIYVVHYTKDTIDDEQFARDVPSGVRENITPTQIAGVKAVAFESSHAGLGRTYEVWAIHNNYLYELAVPYTDKKILDDMVKSWRFLDESE